MVRSKSLWFGIVWFVLILTSVSAGDLPYKEGELLVRFAPDKNGATRSIAEHNKILKSLDMGTARRNFKLVPGLCVVKLPEGVNVEQTMEKFNKNKTRAKGNILYAIPNYRGKFVSTFPNDPYSPKLEGGKQWGLHNIGQFGGTPDADIDAPEAWDIETGNGQIIVAVIDSGVDYTHPDLAPNMWVNPNEAPGDKNGDGRPGIAGVDDDDDGLVDEDSQDRQPGEPGYTNDLVSDDDENGYIDDIYGYDFFNDDGNPIDDGYHGTHCAGIIGAVGNNGVGVTGVCWNVKIMALKVGDLVGPTVAAVIEAIEYSIQMGAKVSNNSWGVPGVCPGSLGYPEYLQAMQILEEAIEEAGEAGQLFVTAAGNDGRNLDDGPCAYPRYPAAFSTPCIISVMATDDDDERSFWGGEFDASNYGITTVDLGAPGSNILSTMPAYCTDRMANGEGCAITGCLVYCCGDLCRDYDFADGTSAAAPHVAGACALVWSMNSQWSSAEVKDIILQSVDTLPSLEGLCLTRGRLNLFNAVMLAADLRVKKWYVDDNAPDANGDGTSWENAFKYLQDALNNPALQSGDEIRVAQGLYKPDLGNGITPGDRTSAFQLRNDVVLKGGYAGLAVPSNPNIRDIGTYQTILSGDIDGDQTLNNNSYQVVTVGSDIETTFDGFTIKAGNADGPAGSPYSRGGGLYNVEGRPTVKNCVIRDCYAMGGGGAANRYTSFARFENCVFYGNSGYYYGGGMYTFHATVELRNCVFTNNSVVHYTGFGGGIIFGDNPASPAPACKVINCTFSGNYAPATGSGIANNGHSPVITNSILWDSTESEIVTWNAPYPVITYSDVKTGYEGEGNFSIDPALVNTSNPAGADGIFCTSDDGLRLTENSLCIDVANDGQAPPSDILGLNRVDVAGKGFSVSDVGAYEYTPLAENAIPVCSCQDLNTPDAYYYLTEDLLGDEVTAKCISIKANGITFDGQGYSIKNPNLEDAVIYSEVNNATIMNCDVTASSIYDPAVTNGWGKGIYILDGNSNKVVNNTVTDTFWGIIVDVGNNNSIWNNTIEENAKGIHITGNNNIVKNNLLKNNNKRPGWGLGCWIGEENQFINNKNYGNDYGIVIYGSNHILLKCEQYFSNRRDIYLYRDNYYLPINGQTGVNRDINAYGVTYSTKYIGYGAEFNEYSDDCDDVDCLWQGDECQCAD